MTGGSGGGGGGRGLRGSDDVGVVPGVDHVHGQLGQRPERLAALDAAQDAAPRPLAAARQPHVLPAHQLRVLRRTTGRAPGRRRRRRRAGCRRRSVGGGGGRG